MHAVLTTALILSCLGNATTAYVMQDHVWQPFEDLLPYHEFTVRLSVKDVPNIVRILRAYTPEQMDAMRLAMARVHTAFLWHPEAGGEAYNYTIKALRLRLHNHAAEYYRKE